MRTGNLKLRMAVFRRLAPIFRVIGKANHQMLATQHLFDLAAMPDSDLSALSEIFSAGVSGDRFARVRVG